MAFKLKESRGEAKYEMEKYLSPTEWDGAAVEGQVPLGQREVIQVD
jgi:hypothetical protein